MKISANGLALIKEAEGFKSRPYLCPAGYVTIGYGHVIKDGENYTELTEKQANVLLLEDVKIAEDCIIANVKTQLTQDQFDALVSFVFNVGRTAFLQSTMLKVLNNVAV